jgi:hypothetical protein
VYKRKLKGKKRQELPEDSETMQSNDQQYEWLASFTYIRKKTSKTVCLYLDFSSLFIFCGFHIADLTMYIFVLFFLNECYFLTFMPFFFSVVFSSWL